MTMNPIKPTIAFETFNSLDIRLCKIEELTEIRKNPKKPPGDDNPVKAYRLVIDTGVDRRECVTNLVSKPPEALLGHTLPFVLNLPESEIRGVQSRAMIIAASAPDRSTINLISVDAAPGTVVI